MQWLHSKMFRLSAGALLFSLLIICWSQLTPYLYGIWSISRTVLKPFLLAALVAYFLHPAIAWFRGWGIPHTMAILTVYACLICFLVVLFMLTLPTLEFQLEELLRQFPNWNLRLQDFLQSFQNHGKKILPRVVWDGINNFNGHMQTSLTRWVEGMINRITDVVDKLFMVLIIPFLSFYMLKDARLIQRYFLRALPVDWRRTGLQILRDLDCVLGQYIRGQFLICMLVFIATYLGYVLIGLPYPLLLSALVGITNVIPYFGPFIGALPALIVSLLLAPQLLVPVCIVNLLIQVVEGNLLSPHIIGRTLDLHPLTVIFVLLLGGEIAGIMGLLLAIPFTAMSKVIVGHLIHHRARNRRVPTSPPFEA
ncbi:AI-2E family transporter [Pasteuria penetrans]|uniref:AI-2E family transporter n=1 Tax=Pasteuria penetrans TaxID=86005 RepID=UPI000F908D3B|nr:AI-2E family transporter [Pasteuria penetrans]